MAIIFFLNHFSPFCSHVLSKASSASSSGGGEGGIGKLEFDEERTEVRRFGSEGDGKEG